MSRILNRVTVADRLSFDPLRAPEPHDSRFLFGIERNRRDGRSTTAVLGSSLSSGLPLISSAVVDQSVLAFESMHRAGRPFVQFREGNVAAAMCPDCTVLMASTMHMILLAEPWVFAKDPWQISNSPPYWPDYSAYAAQPTIGPSHVPAIDCGPSSCGGGGGGGGGGGWDSCNTALCLSPWYVTGLCISTANYNNQPIPTAAHLYIERALNFHVQQPLYQAGDVNGKLAYADFPQNTVNNSCYVVYRGHSGGYDATLLSHLNNYVANTSRGSPRLMTH
jgi:hypothetical protein